MKEPLKFARDTEIILRCAKCGHSLDVVSIGTNSGTKALTLHVFPCQSEYCDGVIERFRSAIEENRCGIRDVLKRL